MSPDQFKMLWEFAKQGGPSAVAIVFILVFGSGLNMKKQNKAEGKDPRDTSYDELAKEFRQFRLDMADRLGRIETNIEHLQQGK